MGKYAHTSEDGTRKQTVAEHLMGTAELAARFAAPFGAQEVAQAAGLLHDIGKYSDAFQRRLLEGGGRTDHPTAGAQVAFRQRMAEVAFAVAGHHGGLPCRVVSTSLIEAGVDVDFPIAYREETGLDSIMQTAGRCNREGKRSAGESVVTVFRLAERPVAMIAQNIAAARQVLRKHQDPASPEAIREYFQFYRSLKGEEALDQKQILDLFRRGYQGSSFPFAEVARRFQLIESPTMPVYIPVGDGARLVELLREGRWSRGLFRALGQYVVNVYPQHYQALFDAGALEQVEEAAVLREPALYHGDTGLQLDVETGKGWFL